VSFTHGWLLDMKIKDIARAFGKKFSCGTSVGETPTGLKEVVIQGDVIFQLPDILIKEYKVSMATEIFALLLSNHTHVLGPRQRDFHSRRK
jgi:hypothetical protein